MGDIIEISITFAIYFLIIFSVAIIAFKVTKSHEDYILGGRSLSGVVTAMGVGASDMSGWLMLGLPGAIYLFGLNNVWMPIGLMIGAYACWILVAKRLRIYTEVANNSLTIPTYFENRFYDHTHILRVIVANVVVVFFTAYSAAGFVSGALLFSTVFDFSYQQGLLICVIAIILYTAIGGFLAVNWVDLFQGGLMLFALIILPVMAIMQLGGFAETMDRVELIDSSYFNIIKGMSLVGILSLLGWGLGYFGQPHILVRFMAAKRPKDIGTARRVCMSWMILSLLGAVLVGFVGIAFFAADPLTNPETVFLQMAGSLINIWLVGIFYAAVLSAIMSTIAAQLLVVSSAVAEDGYRILRKREASQSELIWVGRITILFVAIIAFWIASDPNSRVLDLVAYAWGGLGATFGPVILLSLFWRNMTRMGAVVGMILSGLTVVLWDVVLVEFIGSYAPEAAAIYSIIPGFIVGVIGIVLGSAISKPEPEMLADFEEYQKQLKNV